MPDLTLKEALEQYEAECREVLGSYKYEILTFVPTNSTREWDHCLGWACVQWLAGKYDRVHNKMAYPLHHPTEPLRFYLNEVREHMK